MTMQYAGKILPKIRRSPCYREGRLPESERIPDSAGMAAAGWTTLQHSTTPDIRHGSTANLHSGEYMRRLNKMFTKVNAEEMPTIARGRAAKDFNDDPMYVALKAQDVDTDHWFTDGQEYSEDAARKLQSKINIYAKAGAGAFRTSYRGRKVYIMKVGSEYVKQRNAG